MSFKRKINRLSQFPTAKGHNAHKLKEILLKMGVDAERSPELASQYKAILDMFISQYEAEAKTEVKPVAKKKAIKTDTKSNDK